MILNRGAALKYQDFVDRIDYDKLYEDLAWEPKESSGHEDKGYCLMPQNHTNGDTTGKLAINREKGVYNCWVCGGGSILSLVMEVKDLGYQEASAYLFGFVDSVSKESPDDFYTRVEKLLATEKPQKKPLPYFNTRVLEPWLQEDHDWFAERHISDAVRDYFLLGFDETAKRFHPKYGGYEGPGIILPHMWDGKLVGWQTRWLNEDRPKHIQKYTNTTDFPRETTLWGYHFALKQAKPPIIVESVPTALMLISEGYPAIATFGSQVTPDQLRLLRVFNQGVMLAPDNDVAGTNWLSSLTEYLERFVSVLHVPVVDGHGSDLGDLHPDELPTHLKGVRHGFS